MRRRSQKTTMSEQRPSPEVTHLLFVGRMVHHLGHSVAEIKALAEQLAHGDSSRLPHVMGISTRIAKAADELASGFRMMRLSAYEEKPVRCDFMKEILEPVLSFVGMNSRLHLLVDPSIRLAPRVLVRPGLVKRALLLVLIALRPESIQCSGEVHEDSILFRLIVHILHTLRDEVEIEPFAVGLRDAGVPFTTEFRREDGALKITLNIERAAP